MMRTVLSQWQIGKYTALELNEDIPLKKYSKYRIEGKEYEPVPVYDLPKHIAIEGEGEFVGNTVEFV